MRVLVTGASGFTGRHLALTLSQRGYAVRGLVRDPKKARDLQDAGIELAIGDLSATRSVDRAVNGVDAVYHIAALYREAKNPDEMYKQVNVEGTRHVLDSARRHEVARVIHCSTVGVHGDVDVPADENAPFAPGDIYQVTKLDGEKMAQERFSTGQPGVVVRPAGIYGPGDLRFLKLFRSIDKGTFRMIGSGEVFYHLTYIDDLVDGIIRAGEHPQAVGNTYILAGPRYTTLNELTQAIGKVLHRPLRRGRIPITPVLAAARVTERFCRWLNIEPPLHERRVAFFIKHRGFRIDKARREIGYAPHVDIHEGLARTANWYRANGLL